MASLPKIKVDKAWVSADPLTALLSGLVTLAAIFGLWTWLGLTADQVALLGGTVATIGSSLRTLYVRKNLPGNLGSLSGADLPTRSGEQDSLQPSNKPGVES